MILAYLLLLTGLTISAVAIYYSVVGLTAIFSAAAIPIIIMGSALEVAKLVCASWLKANWERAPRFMKTYMVTAVIVLMLITSMGIFGFLSKAHNDQNLVSGDVQSKIAIYDEKIKTARENIEADRKQLRQMDDAVDQVMGRSTDEKGADKANNIRRSQQRDRVALAKDIEANQKLIAKLNDEAAPIRAEVRKVEAEVGPIKYIAKFIYGEKGVEENMLEKAVTWIIILIVTVFDPLAVIMLLAAQMTFGWFKEEKEQDNHTPDPYVADVGEKPTPEEVVEPESEEKKIEPFYGTPSPYWPFPSTEKDDSKKLVEEAPYHPGYEDVTITDDAGMVEEPVTQEERNEEIEDSAIQSDLDQWNKMIEEAEAAAKREAAEAEAKKYQIIPELQENLDNQRYKPDLTEVIEPEDSKKKTYMTKDPLGRSIVKEIKK